MKNKKEISKKKLSYLDYACKVGERVQWGNIRGEKFEGVILEWKEDSVAVLKFDDGTTTEVQC